MLSIVSNDPDESYITIALTGTGLAAPQITLSEEAFQVTSASGTAVTRVLTIGNAAGSELSFTLGILNGTAAAGVAGPVDGATGRNDGRCPSGRSRADRRRRARAGRWRDVRPG